MEVGSWFLIVGSIAHCVRKSTYSAGSKRKDGKRLFGPVMQGGPLMLPVSFCTWAKMGSLTRHWRPHETSATSGHCFPETPRRPFSSKGVFEVTFCGYFNFHSKVKQKYKWDQNYFIPTWHPVSRGLPISSPDVSDTVSASECIISFAFSVWSAVSLPPRVLAFTWNTMNGHPSHVPTTEFHPKMVLLVCLGVCPCDSLSTHNKQRKLP